MRKHAVDMQIDIQIGVPISCVAGRVYTQLQEVERKTKIEGARIQHVQIQALINNFMQVYVNMQQKSKKVRVTLNWFPDLTSKGETHERPPAGKGC